MVNLPRRTRHKAIEIANALLAEGYQEGRAIRIGISQSKRWAAGPRERRSSPPRHSAQSVGYPRT
jgi:uncharacterized protein YdaT